MDLNAIRTRVRKLTGVVMETLLTPTELDLIINEAYLHVCSLAEWTFLYADAALPMVVGQTTYALPGDVATARSVSVTAPTASRALLRPRTLEDLDRFPQWEAEATAGIPWAWAIRSDTQIDVFPAPDSATTALLVRGWKEVAPLALDADEPVFAAEFHPVVSLDAAARVLAEEGAAPRSARYRNEVVSYLLRMGQRYSLPDPEAPARIYAAAAEDADALEDEER